MQATIVSLPDQVINAVERIAAQGKTGLYAEAQELDGFVGKEFEYVIKPSTSYDAGMLDLQIKSDTVAPYGAPGTSLDRTLERFPTLELKPKVLTDRGAYIGQNAFGATARVARFQTYSRVVMPSNLSSDQAFGVRVALQAAEARALAATARFVIKGRISRSSTGSVAACRRDFITPTLDNPNAASFETCWVAIDLVSITAIDGRAKEVLRTWTFDTPRGQLPAIHAKDRTH